MIVHNHCIPIVRFKFMYLILGSKWFETLLLDNKTNKQYVWSFMERNKKRQNIVCGSTIILKFYTPYFNTYALINSIHNIVYFFLNVGFYITYHV